MLWLVNRRGVLDVWFTFVFSRAEEAAAGAGSDCKVSRIYGVVGIIRLLAGESPSPNFTNYELLHFFLHFAFFAYNSVLLCCNIIKCLFWDALSAHLILLTNSGPV